MRNTPLKGGPIIPKFEIAITSAYRKARINRRLLKKMIEFVLADSLGAHSAIISLRIVGKEEMARKNTKYLGHDGPTDVIAFEYDRGDLIVNETPKKGGLGRVVWGDILVCPDVAFENAEHYRTSPAKELARYIIHGILHLSGYDDKTQVSKRRMKKVEDKILRSLCKKFDLDSELLVRR